ncbi:MAG: flagellum-specific ATP synthase FliI, partial [Roseovarius sp.]|nr:flagellum-specific ATP synthase FliI [Roseovarius sp.]
MSAVKGNTLRVSGLSSAARLGDRVRIQTHAGAVLTGEVLQLETASLLILPDSAPEGVALGDRVLLLEAATIAPAASWIGRIIDPLGEPLDGRPLLRGPHPRT